MSDCDFRFDIPAHVDEAAVLSRVRSAVSGAGGSLTPTGNGHDFSIPSPMGEFMGDILVSGQTVYVRVTRKPAFVPCSMIEIKLAAYVKGR